MPKNWPTTIWWSTLGLWCSSCFLVIINLKSSLHVQLVLNIILYFMFCGYGFTVLSNITNILSFCSFWAFYLTQMALVPALFALLWRGTHLVPSGLLLPGYIPPRAGTVGSQTTTRSFPRSLSTSASVNYPLSLLFLWETLFVATLFSSSSLRGLYSVGGALPFFSSQL